MFKEYRNKSSLSKRFSRQLQGGETEVKGNKLGWWERLIIPEERVTDLKIKITDKYHKRPDMVAYDFYAKRSDLFWLVLQYNGIVDVEEEFIKGKEIFIPSRHRAFTFILDKNAKSERLNQNITTNVF